MDKRLEETEEDSAIPPPPSRSWLPHTSSATHRTLEVMVEMVVEMVVEMAPERLTAMEETAVVKMLLASVVAKTLMAAKPEVDLVTAGLLGSTMERMAK